MQRFDPARLIFYATAAVTAFGLVFGLGLYSAAKQTVPYRLVRAAADDFRLVWSERDTAAEIMPIHHIWPAQREGRGVTVNALAEGADDLVLLVGFFDGNNGLRLIRRDGSVVARWVASFERIFGEADPSFIKPKSDWNTYLHGAVALRDGSVVFNFENVGSAKLDRCGDLVWRTDRVTHHSIERARGGGFWVPGQRYFPAGTPSPRPPFRTPFTEDTVMKLSDDGTVTAEYSVIDILQKNRLEWLVTLTGNDVPKPMFSGFPDNELLHLNDVEELAGDLADDFPGFAAGDLMLSLRNRNLVLVVDPATKKVKWWHIGPWIRQHDPDFDRDGRISVFNNNQDGTGRGTVYGGSTIVEIDPATGRSRVVYGGRADQKMYAAIRGKHQSLPGGRILITEPQGGRAFEVNAQGKIIWQYINRYNADKVAMITEAHAYPADYFTVADWSCERPR